MNEPGWCMLMYLTSLKATTPRGSDVPWKIQNSDDITHMKKGSSTPLPPPPSRSKENLFFSGTTLSKAHTAEALAGVTCRIDVDIASLFRIIAQHDIRTDWATDVEIVLDHFPDLWLLCKQRQSKQTLVEGEAAIWSRLKMTGHCTRN